MFLRSNLYQPGPREEPEEATGLAYGDLSALDQEDAPDVGMVRPQTSCAKRRSLADDDMSDEEDDAPLSSHAVPTQVITITQPAQKVIASPAQRAAVIATPAQQVVSFSSPIQQKPTAVAIAEQVVAPAGKMVPEPFKLADVAAKQASAAPTSAMQVAECKAKIAELQQFKEQKLQQEDYMGAHHVKLLIQEQEEKLSQLRQQLDSMPTPSRLHNASMGGSGRRGPRVSTCFGGMPKRKREQSPVAWRMDDGEAGESNLPAPSSLQPTPSNVPASSHNPPASHAQAEEADEEMPQQPVDGADGQQQAMEGDEDEGEGEEVEEDEEVEAGQWRSCREKPELVELPFESPETPSFKLPRDVFEKLYPYQRAGVAWMARIFQSQQGGILADEMGLGKTIQVCALLNGARKAGATHALLLMPVTLLDQWSREARIWCPGWPVHLYYGSQAQRVQALRRVQRPEGGILITSYQMLGYTEDLCDISVDDAPSPPVKAKGKGRGRGNSGGGKRRKLDDDDHEDGVVSDENPFEPEIPECGLPRTGSTQPWDIVVCDEAHRMKNISTLLGKSLRGVRSKCRILLTGTPVQNALQDLWALMDFAQPGLLGNHATFVKTFSDPIDRGSVRGAKVWAVELKKHLAQQLRSLISPHLLRRTKAGAGLMAADSSMPGGGDNDGALVPICDAEEDMEPQEGQVKRLPPKKETIVWLAPSSEQVSAYQKILEKSEVIKEACSKSKLGVEVFRAIGLLKRLCNHPLLLLPTPKPGDWAQLLSECQKEASSGDEEGVGNSEENQDVATPGSNDARAGRAAEMMLRKLPRSMEAIRAQSAKLRCLSTLLPALAARGHRTLVFSASLKMLDLIQVCCLRPNGLPCLRVDGQTDPVARAEKVAKFQQQQSRFKCMLLTTNVGGVGLNLTSADRVILVDPAWNPATDAQAVDRAFRIGQTKEVRVYRLIMSGLIEDKMFRLQVFKMGLTKTALEAGQQQSYFTAREIRALFEWVDPAEGETRKLLVEKHGEAGDKAIQDAAAEDGSADGWVEAGPSVGLSDFSQLYGCHTQEQEEEKKDENCEAQVAEAKARLGAADEKLQRMLEARKAAEAQSEKTANELKEAMAVVDQFREKKPKAEEAFKEAKWEAAQARKAEATAQARVDKATRSRNLAQEQHANKKQSWEDVVKMADIAAGAVNDAVANARTQEEALAKVLTELEGQLAAFDESGTASAGGPVDAAPDKFKRAQKALEKMRTTLEVSQVKQEEVDTAEGELSQAEATYAEAQYALTKLGEADDHEDAKKAAARKSAESALKGREKDKQKAEMAIAKAQSKMDGQREAILSNAQALTEAGVALADSFKKTETRVVKMDKVKEAQACTKAIFRQLTSAAQAAKKVREACGKAIANKRKAQQKGYTASLAVASAEAWLDACEAEFREASSEDEAKRSERAARDADLAKAEAARSALEVQEAEAKRKRDDLKAAKPAALEALKVARAAEKEACNERQSLHTECSKVEKDLQQLETAKNCAVQTLRAEEYDAKQVERAYEKQQKGNE